MNLRVETTALRTYSSALQAWSDDTAEATSYVAANLNLEWSDAMMFQPVVQVNESVVAAINDAVARIRVVTEASAAELRAVATMYDHTDRGVAHDMDDVYEAVGPPAQRYGDTATPPTDTVPEPPETEPAAAQPTSGAGAGGGGGGGGSW